MKKLVLTLVVSGMFQIVFPQGDYDKTSEVKLPVVSNLTYLSKVYLTESPNVVRALQLKAASFTLSEAKGYRKSETGEFVVVHKASNGDITVSYDKNGEIMTTWERFENVSLPKPIRELIAKKHGDWKIVENKYSGSFSNGDMQTSLYKVKLVNRNRSKNLKINALDI